MGKQQKAEYWKRMVVILSLGWVVIWFSRTMLTPVYEEIQGTIGAQSSLTMGMISSFYFFGYTIIQIPSGILMDKIGKKIVMIPGFFVFLAGLFTIGFATNISMIFVGNLLTGLGTGTYYSGAFSLSGQNVPPQHKFFSTAMINNGCAIGTMFGYLSSGFFVKSAGFNWQTIVFAAAMFAIAMIITFTVGLKRDYPMDKSTIAAEEKVGIGFFFRPHMLTTYFYYFSACYGYYLLITWLPSFLETERNIQGTASSVYACIVAAVSIPGALFFSKLIDRFSGKRVLAMLLLQCSAGAMLVLAVQATAVPLIIASFALYGFLGKQAIDPLVIPHVSGGVPDSMRTTGLGIFNFFGMSGSILAPSLTGYVEDMYGSKILGFYIAVGLMVVSSVLFYITNRNIGKK